MTLTLTLLGQPLTLRPHPYRPGCFSARPSESQSPLESITTFEKRPGRWRTVLQPRHHPDPIIAEGNTPQDALDQAGRILKGKGGPR